MNVLDKIKIVLVEPDIAVPEIKIIPNTLEQFRNLIDGYLEIAKTIGDIHFVVNEEGLIKQLPINRGLYAGNIVVVKSYGEDFVSLSDDEANYWKDFFDMEKRLRNKGLNL